MKLGRWFLDTSISLLDKQIRDLEGHVYDQTLMDYINDLRELKAKREEELRCTLN